MNQVSMANNNSLALARGFQAPIEKSVDVSRLEESQKRDQVEGDPSELKDMEMETRIRIRRNALFTRVLNGSSVIHTQNGGTINLITPGHFGGAGVSGLGPGTREGKRIYEQNKKRLEKEHEERLKRIVEHIVEQAHIVNLPVMIERANREGWANAPWWQQWYTEWQREDQDFKASVRSEINSVVNEFQQRNRNPTWLGQRDGLNRESQWRENKFRERIQKLETIAGQKRKRLMDLSLQLERADSVRQIGAIAKGWEGASIVGNWSVELERAHQKGIAQQVPWWPQWYTQWQKDEQEFKASAKAEGQQLIQELQGRNAAMLVPVEGEIIWAGSRHNHEINWRQSKIQGAVIRLNAIIKHKTERLMDLSLRLEREDLTRQLEGVIKGWEGVKITDERVLREQAAKEGLIKLAWWPQWESQWQKEEQEFQTIAKAEGRRLTQEFQGRNATILTRVENEMIWIGNRRDQEIQWRQSKINETAQKLRTTLNQKAQGLMQRLNQSIEAERVRTSKEKAEREIREWEQGWEKTKESVVLINNGVQLRETASLAGLTANLEWSQWERNWQQEEQAWKSLVRTENLNLLKEFQKRDRDLRFSTADAITAESQWRQARREELNRKITQIHTQKVQSLQEGLNQLLAAEQVRIQKIQAEREAQENAKIIQFFADTATNAVTEYLETETTRIQQETVATETSQVFASLESVTEEVSDRKTSGTTYTYSANNEVQPTDTEGGLWNQIWNATLGSPRVQGGLTMAGGIGEMLIGAVLFAVPAPPTKLGGWALIGHGADMVAAGVKQLWTGQTTQSFTAQGISEGLQTAGVDPVNANLAGGLTEIGVAAVPIGIVGKAAATARITSDAARRQAMRMAGIPTGQQPVSQLRTDAGMQYIYEMHGKRLAVTQQTTDRVVEHSSHWEVGNVKPPSDYGLDPLGRVRVFNEGKIKINYGE